MVSERATGKISLRHIANGVPWLGAFQQAWRVVREVSLTGFIDRPELVKFLSLMSFFALVGAIVSWRWPPYDAEQGLAPNISWMLRFVIPLGLWIEFFEQLWTISTTLWARNPLNMAIVVYTIITALIAVWTNLRWMPRGFWEASG